MIKAIGEWLKMRARKAVEPGNPARPGLDERQHTEEMERDKERARRMLDEQWASIEALGLTVRARQPEHTDYESR